MVHLKGSRMKVQHLLQKIVFELKYDERYILMGATMTLCLHLPSSSSRHCGLPDKVSMFHEMAETAQLALGKKVELASQAAASVPKDIVIRL